MLEAEDAKNKIFVRKSGPPHIVGFPVGAFRRTSDEFEKGQRARVALVSDMHEEAERILLAMYAPAGVLINAEIEILQFRGDTGPCLTPALADKSEPAQDGQEGLMTACTRRFKKPRMRRPQCEPRA